MWVAIYWLLLGVIYLTALAAVGRIVKQVHRKSKESLLHEDFLDLLIAAIINKTRA
jgi:hypothetical protein